MATALKMPRLSKGMTAGEVMEWHKSPGEPVQAGEPLLIVLSEKAEVEVEAPATGILLKTLVSPGEEAPVGAVLAWIGQPGDTLSTAEPAGEPPVVTTSDQAVYSARSQNALWASVILSGSVPNLSQRRAFSEESDLATRLLRWMLAVTRLTGLTRCL